ncbi:MAG: prolipoprotein diacylglyceryl transferase [Clostridia bacterium]|nr:prolipoprotein diacylglyceryl transferase [Clostridia bacterium]
MSFLSIGGFPIYSYGLGLAVSILVASVLLGHTCRRDGLRAHTASLILILAIPLGLLFSRLSYCLIRFSWFQRKGFSFFWQLPKGGFFLYGTLLGVVIAGLIAARITHQKAVSVLSSMVLPGTLLLILAHLCMGLAGEGYGWSVREWFSVDTWNGERSGMSIFQLSDVSLFERFPFAIPDYYEEYHWAVFVLEAILSLCMLLRLWRDEKSLRPFLFLTYFAAEQALGASMRQDAMLKFGFVRVPQLLTVALLLGLLICACVKARQVPAFRKFLSFAGLFASFGVFMAMEFALEKKIAFLAFLSMDLCYLIMILCCLGMIASVAPMLEKGFADRKQEGARA